MCCVRLSVFCLAAVPLLSVGPALLAVVFLSCCFPGLLFGASVVVGCVAARLVAAVQVFWHPFSGHNWASPWFMSCHDMPCFSIPPQVCPAFMGRACVRVEFKMQGCTKTLVSGGDIETNHLSVLAEPSRLHSWSWRQNIVLLFGSSSFDKLLSQFKKWNQMLMTWHYKCLYKQFCPSVCVCVCVHVFAELCGPSHLKWSDLYFPNCLGARVQLMRKEWWKQAWPIANCCTYLIAVIWLCVASSGHDAAVGKRLHILYVVNPPYYCILAGVRGA